MSKIHTERPPKGTFKNIKDRASERVSIAFEGCRLTIRWLTTSCAVLLVLSNQVSSQSVSVERSWNIGAGGDPDLVAVTNSPIDVEQRLMATPFKDYRIAIFITRNDEPFSFDLQARTGEIGLLSLQANQNGVREVYMPIVRRNGQRFQRDCRFSFDHVVDNQISFWVISDNEPFSVTPYYLIGDGTDVQLAYFTDNEFMVALVEQTGSGNTRRSRYVIQLSRPASGLWFDITNGNSASSGPEGIDRITYTLKDPEIVVSDETAILSSPRVQVRLNQPPSLRNSANRVAPHPELNLPSEYRTVKVRLSSAQGLIRFNGSLSAIVEFSAANWEAFQTVNLQYGSDNNEIANVGSQDTVHIDVLENDAKFDDYFAGIARQSISVAVPDDGDPQPTVESVEIENGNRSVVDSAEVTFSTEMQLDGADFQLMDSMGKTIPLDFSEQVTNGKTVATVFPSAAYTEGTPRNALADETYTLVVRTTATDQFGNTLLNESQTIFEVLFGDLTGPQGIPDGSVTVVDLAFVRRAFGPASSTLYDEQADFDGRDGVSLPDYAKARLNFSSN